nr:MAG TPA: hypothetical protein [Caudoviricetes sp.]
MLMVRTIYVKLDHRMTHKMLLYHYNHLIQVQHYYYM